MMSDTVIRDARLFLMEAAARYREHRQEGANDEAIVRWACDRGHRWDRTVDFAQNVRCMNCAAERREVETRRLRELARVRGGVLLSPYVDAATELSWKCAYGHVWDARPDAASRYWCAECARTVFAGFR